MDVPKILETDFDAGFMLVTDLGTTTYISVLDSTKPSCAARWN